MANSTGSGSPTLDTINNLFGTSLEFPKCFRTPGTASLQTAFTGSAWPGSITGAASNHNPNPTGPLSTLTNGIAQVNGYQNIFGALTVTGQSLFLGGVKGETAYWKLNTGSYGVTSGGGINLTAGDSLNINAVDVNINSAFNLNLNGRNWDVAAATWDAKKPFDIKHPTKPDHRLRYVCVESPSADVYVRGKLNDSNVIELPEYWRNLVDIENISVVLTPYGQYQELFVEKIESETQIIIKNNSTGKIKCDYIVYGERKDTSKNIPEYKGKTANDYPGDNREYVINGMSSLYCKDFKK